MPVHRQLCQEGGVILVVSLVVLVIVSVLALSATTTSRIELAIATNDKQFRQAFAAAEYGLILGESRVAQLRSATDFDPDTTPGYWAQGAQPTWDALQWDATDSVSVAEAYTALVQGTEAATLPERPASLQDDHDLPRYMIEMRAFRRDGLTVGIGPRPGIWLYSVSAHGGRATKTPEEDSSLSYRQRYRTARAVLQSTFATRLQ